MKHFRCWLLGCCEHEDDWTICTRCHRHAYHDGHDGGLLPRIWWRVRRLSRLWHWPRCQNCDKRLKPSLWRHGFCNDECNWNWIPF